MNILFLKTFAPVDPKNSGDFRYWHLMNRGEADVIALNNKEISISGTQIDEPLSWKSLKILYQNPINLPIKKFRYNLSNFLSSFEEYIDKLRKEIESYVNDFRKIVVVAGDYQIALFLIYLKVPFVYDGVDSYSLYFLRRYKSLCFVNILKKANSLRWFFYLMRIERLIASKAYLYIVTGKADKEHILKFCPNGNLFAIGNGTCWINQPAVSPPKPGCLPTIAFHGGMTWEPNQATAIYLIKEVFPIVRSVLPAARIKIAGTPVPPELAKLSNTDNVEICGYVENLQEWLSLVHVYAMPMLHGSGIKNKLIEVMAAGLPIVTNSLGAEALSEYAKESILIVDGKINLANTIINLLQNNEKCQYLREKTRHIARLEFSWEKLSERYTSKLAEKPIYFSN